DTWFQKKIRCAEGFRLGCEGKDLFRAGSAAAIRMRGQGKSLRVGPCISDSSADDEEKLGRGRPIGPRSFKAEPKQGSPRPQQQVEARTVARAAVGRARIAQER